MEDLYQSTAYHNSIRYTVWKEKRLNWLCVYEGEYMYMADIKRITKSRKSYIWGLSQKNVDKTNTALKSSINCNQI